MENRNSTAASLKEAPIETILGELEKLDLEEVRVRWRRLLRSPPPAHLPRYLLVRILAYRLQARAFGDLDRESVRYLEQVEKARRRRLASEERKRRPKAPPPVPPVPVSAGIRPGALLAREWGGRMHTVTVAPQGFCWDGKTYNSLSEIARLITGTQWSGPRFFGLRGRAALTLNEGPTS